ncbi:MAG: ferritin family protein [Methanoregulaceae archaeon]|nr:ferritin family protein [Methanoregulaceae archaeon]
MDQDDFKRILSTAIDREVESYTYYRMVSDKVKDKALKRLFAELAEDETNHRTTLEGFLSKGVKNLKFETSADYKVVDALPTPPLTANLKPVEGLVIAIKKELEAMQMYTQLAASSMDAGQKAVFSQLASMERGHKLRLEDIYTNMAFPEVW